MIEAWVLLPDHPHALAAGEAALTHYRSARDLSSMRVLGPGSGIFRALPRARGIGARFPKT
ncbi:MAG: hypothetical protein ACREWE_07685, partial [Gammaproteobacteria bacterium]